MKRHDSDIDPFNAGEPAMPWEDSFTQDASGEDCKLSEHGYTAPEHDSARNKANARKDATTQKKALAIRAARRATGNGPANKHETDARRAHRKHRRTALLIVLALVLAGFIGIAVTAVVHTIDEVDDHIGYFDPDLDPDFGQDYDNLNDDERDAYAAASIVLENLDGIDAAHTRIADWFEKDVQKMTDFTCAELGIDAEDYADWMLENTTCDITDVYAFTGNDNPDDNYASIYFDATLPSADSFANNFYDQFYSYQREQGIQEGQALSDEQREYVENLFEHAIDNADTETNSTGNLRLTYEDSDVHMTDDDLADMLTSLYWLY